MIRMNGHLSKFSVHLSVWVYFQYKTLTDRKQKDVHAYSCCMSPCHLLFLPILLILLDTIINLDTRLVCCLLYSPIFFFITNIKLITAGMLKGTSTTGILLLCLVVFAAAASHRSSTQHNTSPWQTLSGNLSFSLFLVIYERLVNENRNFNLI